MDSGNIVTPGPIWSHLNVVMQSVSTVISPMDLTMFLTSFFFTSVQPLVCPIILWTGFETILPAGRGYCGFVFFPPSRSYIKKSGIFQGSILGPLLINVFVTYTSESFCNPASCLPTTSNSSIGLYMWRTANSCNPTLTLPISGVWTMTLIWV